MKVSILTNKRIMLSSLKKHLIGISFSLFLFLLSCAQTNGTNNNNERPHDSVIEKEAKKVSNENYQAELQRHMSELRQMDDRNETMKRREEEKELKNWLYGTWEINGYDEWFGRYTSYVCITENNLRSGYNGQDLYNGPYEIDMESHRIIFDRHDGYYTYLDFNPQTERLEDENGVFRKVKNISNSSDSYRSGSDNSSRQTADEAYIEVQRLQNEVRSIINKLASCRSKMSYAVYGSYDYQNARIEYRQLIGTAIEKQKKAIKIAKNKIHDESLANELGAQLELLEQEKQLENKTNTRRGREFSRRGY